MRLTGLAAPAACFAVGLLVGVLLFRSSGLTTPAPPLEEPSAPVRSPSPVELGEDSPKPPAFGLRQVKGRVVTPAGDPVEGVTVIAYREPREERVWPRIGGRRDVAEGPPRVDARLEDRIRYFEKGAGFRAASRREGVSGPDGRFAITGLGEGYYSFRGYLAGYAIEGQGRPGEEELELVAEPTALAEFEVVGPNGTLEQAQIRLEGEETHQFVWSRHHRVLRLPAGTWIVRALSIDGTATSESFERTFTVGGEHAPFLLKVGEAGGLRGTVEFPRGRTRTLDVVALRIPDHGDPDPERLLKEGRGTWIRGGANETADYLIPDLDPGRYLVGVIKRPREVLAATEARVARGFTTLDLVIPPLGEPGAERPLSVLDARGDPVYGLRVSAVHRSEYGGEEALGPVERIEPGRYVLFRTLPRATFTGPGRNLLRIWSEQHGETLVDIDPEATEEVEVRLADPAFVTLTVFDYAGSRYEAEIRLSVERAGSKGRYYDYRAPPPEPDGTQRFGPLPPGDYEAVVRLGRASFVPAVLRRPLPLVSGHQEAVLSLPALYDLEVVLDDGDAGEGFYLESLGVPRSRHSPGPASSGRLRFPHLLPGEYVLSRHRGPREHMPLTIAGHRSVRFRPLVLSALRIEVADPAGALGRAGFLHGDLVVAIDGTEITGEDQGRALLHLAAARGKAVFTVLRGGARIDLECGEETADFGSGERSGGEVRPWTR